MRFCFLIILIFVCTGCASDEKLLREGSWKYCGGYRIGDALTFTDESLRSDTIFFNDTAGAIILGIERRDIAQDEILKILSLDRKDTGTYCHK